MQFQNRKRIFFINHVGYKDRELSLLMSCRLQRDELKITFGQGDDGMIH